MGSGKLIRRFVFSGACLLLTSAWSHALPVWKSDSAALWFQENPDPQNWPEAAATLWNALGEDYAKNGKEVFTRDENFSLWLTHLRWIGTGLGMEKIRQDPAWLRAFVEVGARPAISHTWVRALTGYDRVEDSLEVLLQLHRTHPADLAEFPELGVAYALVFDQPFPAFWPHGQVNPADLPDRLSNPVVRFADMVRNQREKKLELDPRQLSVGELIFVVDTLTPLEEMDWARNNIRLSPGKFGTVFSSIRYDTPRATVGQFVWKKGPYTLANIREKGGICVDQAYFAAMAGKAFGFPTLYFSGQGQGGGHAWFGYMERPGKWNPDCGRYESQNYPVGEALNPQTWQIIRDSDLELLVSDLPKSPRYRPAQSALAWARMNRKSQPDKFLLMIREASGLLPAWPEPWMEAAAQLRESDPAPRKAFFTDWIKNFDKQSDLKVLGQQQLLEILKKENDPGVDALQKEIIRENRRKRFDLGIGAGAEAVFAQIDQGNWEEGEREFKRVVRKFDNQGGGNLFYQLIQPYVLSCLEDAEWKRAEDALKYAEKKMEVGSESILAREFADLRAKVARKWQPPAPTPGGL